MKNFFQNLNYKIQVWMSGRYGNDELSTFLWITGFVTYFLSFIKQLQFLSFVALIIWGWSIYRTLSRNFDSRKKERSKYLRFTENIKSEIKLWKLRWTGRKTHRYFRCSKCHTIIRVPKGQGKILLTCPKCQNQMTKSS